MGSLVGSLLFLAAPLAWSQAGTSLPGAPAAPLPKLSGALLDERVRLAREYFEREQHEDGSWTKLIKVSSVMYNAHMIFLYEYLDRVEEKKDIVIGLMRFIWSQQNADGGLPGYPGGPSNPSVSVLAYVSGKIAGDDENSFRMTQLEAFIKKTKAVKHAGIALPYLMLFELSSDYNCIGGIMQSALLAMNKQLPWVRVLLYPLMHLFAAGKTHPLKGAKFPARLPRSGTCPRWMPHPFRRFKVGEKKFWKWLDKSMNDDGTLFDYTPTTVPGLMALSTGGPGRAVLLEKGISTLESFQVPTPEGIYQSPGEASIGETTGVINSLLEIGASANDPMIRRAEDFLYKMQQTGTGAFGFSKHNKHFPDTDDTSNAIHALTRLSEMRNGGKADAATLKKMDRALSWLVSMQNKDGGFGTWEKNSTSFLDKFARKTGFVLSESVTEHTARIVVMLARHKDRDARYKKAYDKAVKYLLKGQLKDGSYPGTWFVDYLFGTSMVLAALGTCPTVPAVKAAIDNALSFILIHQGQDGGFSESPESFVKGESISMAKSSPAQTGLLIAQLLTFLRLEEEAAPASAAAHRKFVGLMLERSLGFLVATQQADGLWHDKTWTGVTFPKVEYLIYHYIQEVGALQALGQYRLMFAESL